ncbi:tetratricopeptide repeat protein [Anaerostipes faecalis]|uniref:tetratricopeptide repeat protein n=1 Tax=Anaerostipes faecalis TaxID=2738446 RepID=UPI001C1E26CD|nr:tetratricopeptide repeat protein [Anaerostipes faecalis]
MLNFNEELEKFQPCADLEQAVENIYGDELKEIKKNKTELYKANQIIKKYNQALNYAKQGNDDLAMLQLKNVVSAIPNFVDAYLLMALLSVKAEDFETAQEAVNNIFKVDPENESAKEYMKEFNAEIKNPEDVEHESEEKEKSKKSTETAKGIKNPFKAKSFDNTDSSKGPMFYMVTGLIIGVIVSVALIYPTVKASFSHKTSTQVEDYKEQILAKDTQLKAGEKKIKEAQEAQKKAEDELEEYIGTSKKDGIYDLLLKALQQYSDKNYTESANALLDIDRKKLTTKNMKSIYDDLKTKVYPNAQKGLYTEGLNAYYAKDYKKAVDYFKKAIKISDTDVNSYYYLARAYEDNGNTKSAISTYEKIIKKFPGTRSATNSQNRMNALQQKTSKNL